MSDSLIPGISNNDSQSGRALPAQRSHAAYLVPRMRHRHDRQLFRAGSDRIENRSAIAGSGLRHRLHRPRRRLRQAGFVPHHPRPRHPICHWPEAGEPEAECRRVFGRRRPLRHWRQSPDSRRAPQHRSESHLREQPYLRDDGRPDRAHHARSLDYVHVSLRRVRAVVQSAASGRSGRRSLRRALDHVPRTPTGSLHQRSLSEKRLLVSSK